MCYGSFGWELKTVEPVERGGVEHVDQEHVF